MLTAQTIKNQHSDIFTFLHGDLALEASHCHIPAEALRGSLVYVSDVVQLAEVRRHKPAILIVPAKMSTYIDTVMDADSCCFSVQSISMGMAVLLKYFDRKCFRFTQWGERHPTAVVHPDAVVGERAFLGPYCVIGAHAAIGDDCMIGAHTVVENDARIGARTLLHPHVFVGAGCHIGEECEIHPHTSIGSDGFGYAVDVGGRPRKIAPRLPEKAAAAVGNVIAAGIIPAGLEMMDQLAIQAAEDFVHANYPTQAAAILLCELDGANAEVSECIMRVRAK